MSTAFWDDISKLLRANQEIVLTDLTIDYKDQLGLGQMFLIVDSFFFDHNDVLRCRNYPNHEYKLEWFRSRLLPNSLTISNWSVELTPESLIRSLLSDPL